MQTVSECFDKVKTDCFKFIKSQETSKEKFKGKEKMLKSFLIPTCFWISSKAKSKHPFFFRVSRRPRNWQNNNKFNIRNNIKKIL